MDMNYRGGMWEGGGVQDGVKGGKWNNCNSIINKYIYIKEIRVQKYPMHFYFYQLQLYSILFYFVLFYLIPSYCINLTGPDSCLHPPYITQCRQPHLWFAQIQQVLPLSPGLLASISSAASNASSMQHLKQFLKCTFSYLFLT